MRPLGYPFRKRRPHDDHPYRPGRSACVFTNAITSPRKRPGGRLPPGAEPALYDFAALAEELEALTGRRIDLHTLRGVEGDRNRLRRKQILGTMVPVYVA